MAKINKPCPRSIQNNQAFSKRREIWTCQSNTTMCSVNSFKHRRRDHETFKKRTCSIPNHRKRFLWRTCNTTNNRIKTKLHNASSISINTGKTRRNHQDSTIFNQNFKKQKIARAFILACGGSAPTSTVYSLRFTLFLSSPRA